ncbi:hypothetical protein B0H21DRAFT_694091 [Amylocystis lapponica]|nr:hypothetical protein B0H21DRAFT_694091 [Amylocystis lapponica]
MADTPAAAAQLKAEGNALFAKHDYPAAIDKYSKAIDVDSDNAVLYANRAACHLGLKQYLDAVSDAQKATALDPKYAKGWARLASAHMGLNDPGKAIMEWKHALAALPIKNLSASERTQKQQYEVELKAAHNKMQVNIRDNIRDEGHYSIKAVDAPWIREMAIHDELCRQGKAMYHSSITSCFRQAWDRGMSIIMDLKKTQTPIGTQYHGNLMGTCEFTNAILRDSRIFHGSDDFAEMYRNQVTFECAKTRAWTKVASATVIREALQRQRNEGWDSVRPALATTLQGWVMRGFVDYTIRNKPEDALLFYGWTLDVLDWGRLVWKDVPKEDRGTIFEDTSVRGVRCLRLQALMMASALHPGPNSKYPLTDILDAADSLRHEADAAVPSPAANYDPGFLTSFYVYPRGQAFVACAFYHYSLALQAKLNGTNDQFYDHMSRAAISYVTAAEIFPEDDEYRTSYLHNGLDCMYEAKHPVKLLLAVHKKIRLAIPKKSGIWEKTPMSLQDRPKLEADLLSEKKVLKWIAEGRISLEDSALPEQFTRPLK